MRRMERTGILKADGRRAERGYFAASQWMREQVVARLGPPPAGITYPIWAWKVWEHDRPRPDLRASRRHFPSGTLGALIAFTCEENQALLSDFINWHDVLSNHYLAYDEQEYLKVYGAGQREPEPARIRKSWERIFDLAGGAPAFWGPVKERRIQATLWCVRLDQVRSVKWFRTR